MVAIVHLTRLGVWSRAIVLCFAGVLSRGFKMSERCWHKRFGHRSCNDSLVYIGGKCTGLVCPQGQNGVGSPLNLGPCLAGL